MTYLPDPVRPRLTQPARRMARGALRLLSAAAWRTLHPSTREPFVEAPRPTPLPRLHVETPDGWVLPLFRLDPAPGGAGDPILLVHSAAGSAHAFRYGSEGLAQALAAAGYTVFLATHRGDQDAQAPLRPTAVRLADVAALDLPEALMAVREATGAHAVHVGGFGLGAVLAMGLAARCRDEVASVTALAPPLCLPTPSTHARSVAVALGLLPAHWSVPLRSLARAGVPLIEGGVSPGDRLRGQLAYTTEDLPLSVAEELLDWVARGTPHLAPGVDFEASLADARAPLHVLQGSDDTLARPESAARAQAAWGGETTVTQVAGAGHLDLLLGRDVAADVHKPLIEWLVTHRDRAWAGTRVSA